MYNLKISIDPSESMNRTILNGLAYQRLIQIDRSIQLQKNRNSQINTFDTYHPFPLLICSRDISTFTENGQLSFHLRVIEATYVRLFTLPLQPDGTAEFCLVFVAIPSNQTSSQIGRSIQPLENKSESTNNFCRALPRFSSRCYSLDISTVVHCSQNDFTNFVRL